MNNPQMPKIQIEITALNDGSHFSEEHKYIVHLNFFILLFLILYLGLSTMKIWKEFKLGESFEQPLTFLMLGIFSELILIVLELLNNLVVYVDGTSYWIITFFTSGWRIGTQSIIFAILLLIASGWSLTFKSFFDKDGFMILMGGVIVSNVLIAMISTLDDGEYHKFHDYSGWPGILLILLRIGLFVWFNNLASKTEKEMP